VERDLVEHQHLAWHETDQRPEQAIPPGTLVVGIDGSDGSVLALTWALREAARRGLELDAVLGWTDAYSLVAPTPLSALSKGQRARLKGRVESTLRHAEEQLLEPSAVTARTHVFSGRPAELLSLLSTRAALVVVGSHGYGSLKASVLGSVSRACVQAATGPVVVVRGSRRPLDATTSYDHILVGVDGSECGRAALLWAIDEARATGDHLEAVHAWGTPGLGVMPPGAESDLEKTAVSTLAEAKRDLHRSGCSFTSHLEYGTPGGVLAIRSKTADLVVVGSRGRSGLPGLLLGSVSEQCLAHSDCPVAIVRV